jgi:signal transduction histidine kinase
MEKINQVAEKLFKKDLQRIVKRTDILFVRLLLGQYLFGICLALLVSPYTWEGEESSWHIHLYAAVILGLIIISPAIYLGKFHQGKIITRHVIAIAQILLAALFIHLTGGRIETHFLLFASLPILAFYRDFKVLLTATVIIYLDHLARGFWYPESVYGVLTATPWRSLEHASWILFEVVFLVYSNKRSIKEMKQIAQNQTDLEDAKLSVEDEVTKRTDELVKQTKELETQTKELEAQTTELEKEINLRKDLETQLVQAQKMESIGQLASGVAHEINTPTQYVGNNISFFKESFEDMVSLREKYRDILSGISKENLSGIAEELESVDKEFDIDYLLDEVPKAFSQTSDGVVRIAEIVSSMKSFAHPGGHQKKVKLKELISTVVTVATNEWKHSAKVTINIPNDFPEVPLYPGEFNQVILSLIVNAADAIKDAIQEQKFESGEIIISAKQEGNEIKIIIADNGLGIPEDIQTKIFDPSFTTKQVGKRTGQGLALAHNLIAKKHAGSLHFETIQGTGTKFIVTIPNHQSE